VRVGRYEVLGEAGRGGLGVVLRARAPDGAIVAIKIPTRAPDPEARARFEREVRLLDAFGEEDGFVPLIDSGEHQGMPFLVMPFFGGGTLRAKLERGRLSPEAAVALVLSIARSMAVAHARGVVHRDLKPENVLFAASGKPLVADLGLAKHWKGTTPGASQTVLLSHAGQLKGTIGYMAPEQAEDSMSVGPPADVFSLGAILYECLTGEPAFRGEGLLAVLERIVKGDFERRRSTDGSRWLDAVVETSLHPNPSRRYADAGALAKALEAGPSGAVPRGRRRAALVLGAGVALAALGILALALGRARTSPLEEARTRLQEARGDAPPAARLALALEAAGLVPGDGPEERATRGEALELAARLDLESGDAKPGLAAARDALALAPDSEERRLLVAQVALRAGEPEEASSVLEKTLEMKAPPLDAFRAAGLALLARSRFAEAEALARRGLSLHGDDPSLLVMRGRALRGLARSAEAIGPLAAAERAGAREAHSERALATIEACPIDRIDDPRKLVVTMDKDAMAVLLRQVDALLATIEREWPAAGAHPSGRDVALSALARACDLLTRTRAITQANLEPWTRLYERARALHATITRAAGDEVTDATAAVAVLALYAEDSELAARIAPRAGSLSLRGRFALRANLGISSFMPANHAASGMCHFDGDESSAIALLDAALGEDAAALGRACQEDGFLMELRRAALRIRAWALWHRAARDPSHADDLPRSEQSGREADALPTAFPAYKDGPVLVCLIPAVLLQSKLDEAEELIARLEAFEAEWGNLGGAPSEAGRRRELGRAGEASELRGDLEMRRHHLPEAAAAFERAARSINTRSSWLGLARAREELGDARAASLARQRALSAEESYLTWLERP
jgi:tetratricopeptide (TPR) repeat protein